MWNSLALSTKFSISPKYFFFPRVSVAVVLSPVCEISPEQDPPPSLCLAPSPGTWVRPPGITATQLLAVIAAFKNIHCIQLRRRLLLFVCSCISLLLQDFVQYWLPRDLSCSEHLSHKWSLDRKGFAICDHLWVVLFIVLWFGFFPFCVCVLEDGVAGPDKGNTRAGNWAALLEICFSHLMWTEISHFQPKWSFLDWFGLSDFNHSLPCNFSGKIIDSIQDHWG